jgi:tetratricopeptide (TPR) repeat protein
MMSKLILPQTVREDARPVQTAALVLEAALDMHRDGTLDHLLTDRPGAARWLMRNFLQPILGAAGDALPPEHAMTTALTWLMEWAITQLRPDRAPTLHIGDRKAWLDSTSWRPMIAAMCHFGFARVPDFKDRYYRREDESPADNLCGLWNVGSSTYYRYLEKAKRLMARALYEQRLDQRHALSIWEYAEQKTHHLLEKQQQDLKAWHRAQIDECLSHDDAYSAFWHAQRGNAWTRAIEILKSRPAPFTRYAGFEADLFNHKDKLTRPEHIQLLLAIAEMNRVTGNTHAELENLEQALHFAAELKQALPVGIVYGHLGRFYESRDADRAFACFQESVSFISRIDHEEASFTPEERDEIVLVFTKLGWFYALRNDPRAEAMLQKADALRTDHNIRDITTAMLEQALGEVCRRKGDYAQALDHKHRALSLYERLNDKAGVAKTYINLGLIYENAKSYDLAVSYYSQVLNGNFREHIGVEGVVNALLNLGACYFWQRKFDKAIAQYAAALTQSEQARLNWHIGTAHYNLAEAYYSRFVATRHAGDEVAGDEHAAKAFDATRVHYPVHAENALRLKARILSGEAGTTVDQLVPSERAVHPIELSKIDQLLVKMAEANSPYEHADLHMQVAGEYLVLALNERDTAMKWLQQGERHDAIDRHLQAFQREINKLVYPAVSLAQAWQHSIGLSQDAAHCAIDKLMQDRFLTKSSYADACGVSLATASKHLGLLAERGLLVQTGKGPATKYALPQTEPA